MQLARKLSQVYRMANKESIERVCDQVAKNLGYENIIFILAITVFHHLIYQ